MATRRCLRSLETHAYTTLVPHQADRVSSADNRDWEDLGGASSGRHESVSADSVASDPWAVHDDRVVNLDEEDWEDLGESGVGGKRGGGSSAVDLRARGGESNTWRVDDTRRVAITDRLSNVSVDADDMDDDYEERMESREVRDTRCSSVHFIIVEESGFHS